MAEVLLILAACCCSSSLSGVGAYFMGYIPGNDKYYTRVLKIKDVFVILDDIKKEIKFEGSPNKYMKKISNIDFCEKIKKYKEELDEQKVLIDIKNSDYEKLLEKYMKDNEITGYTGKQITKVINFISESCLDDIRVFKKTDAFMAKLKILFNETPTEATKKDEFCNDTLKEDGTVTIQGFNSINNEIKSVNNLYSLDDVWDEDNGVMESTGYNTNDLSSSIDFCSPGPSPGPSA